MAQLASGAIVSDAPTDPWQSQIDSLVTVSGGAGSLSTNALASSGTPQLSGVSPFIWIGVVVGMLIAIKVAMEHEKSGIDPEILGVGTANFIVVGLLATLFIWFEKLILNKWPVTGLTQMVNSL